MDMANQGGAAVLLAFAGILPLSMYLRRRRGGARSTGVRVAAIGSTALLLAGLAATWL